MSISKIVQSGISAHTVIAGDKSEVTISNGAGYILNVVTIPKGVWHLELKVQGASTPITNNDKRIEFQIEGTNIQFSLPHNTPYPVCSGAGVIEISESTVIGIRTYNDNGSYTIDRARIVATKLMDR